MTNLPDTKPTVSPKKQPKIVSYGSALYAKMLEDSQEVDNTPVWRGRLIQTCLDLGVPAGYYKKVVDALRAMDCIDIVSRGRRGSTLTTIILKQLPTQELYDQTIVRAGWDGLTSAPSPDTLAARLDDLSKQLGGLNIPELFRVLDDRLKVVETAVKELTEQAQHHNQLIATLIGEQRR